MYSHGLYVDGRWLPSGNRPLIDVVNPATEQTIGRVAAAAAGDVDQAVAAARVAFSDWSQTNLDQRVSMLRRIGAGIERRQTELALTVSREMGMPVSQTLEAQVQSVLGALEDFIDIAEQYPFVEEHRLSITLREPIGVCGLITPWNFPLAQIAGKLFPALAAGCTTVLKPSELAPLSVIMLAEIIDDSGLPAGVFNLINGYGPEAGAMLAAHPEVDMISLTGSTRAGVYVVRSAADTLKRVALELGGKSPWIVTHDTDLRSAVEACVRNCFFNSGQCCDAPTRLLVPADLERAAVAIAAEIASSLRVGDPEAEDTDLGPLVSADQRSRVLDSIRMGVDQGAELVAGGLQRPAGQERGYFVSPTVFSGVRNSMTIAQEEIFGPVLCVIPYSDQADAIRIANDSKYGLAAYLSTPDASHALTLAKQLRAGQVRLQGAVYDGKAPFGGYRMSGIGREFGTAGFEEFLEIKAFMGCTSP